VKKVKKKKMKSDLEGKAKEISSGVEVMMD
jgi:hypothetical protein